MGITGVPGGIGQSAAACLVLAAWMHTSETSRLKPDGYYNNLMRAVSEATHVRVVRSGQSGQSGPSVFVRGIASHVPRLVVDEAEALLGRAAAQQFRFVGLVDVGYATYSDGCAGILEIGYIICHASNWEIVECANFFVDRSCKAVNSETLDTTSLARIKERLSQR
eukprot:3985567-Pyramimonas_sp.AAC.1